jgi:Fe-S-cluster containining protein
MTDLYNEFRQLKSKYREIFLATANEIQKEIQNISIKERTDYFDSIKLPKIKAELEKIRAMRKNFNCIGCGVCCKFAVSEFSPEELETKASNGDIYAKQFITIFEPYSSRKEVENIFPQYLELLDKMEEKEYYIYHCPKVTQDNRCPDYNNRPQICRDFPDNPIAFLPLTCGYLGWKKQSEEILLKLHAQMEIIEYLKK